MSDTESEQVLVWMEEYPYFVLPYFMEARRRGEKDALFGAALLAPNRILLKRYVEGTILLRDKVQHQGWQKEVPDPREKPRNAANWSFSLVDFDELSGSPQVKTVPFCVYDPPGTGPKDEYLDFLIKIQTARYLVPLRNPVKKRAGEEEMDNKGKEGINGDPLEMLTELLEARKPLVPTLQEIAAPDSAALDSVEATEDMVTETLARLHIKQGNTQAAIRIYRKLSLLFPEKSAYFEGQIEKIASS